MPAGATKEINIVRQFVLLACAWSALILAAMGYDMWNSWRQHLQAGRLQAGIAIEKDILYHDWISQTGGLYAPISKNLPVNPYLTIPNRDLATVTGTRLTMIDPAFMTRQVHEMAGSNSPLAGHLTSLHPLRPDNGPDAWERRTLRRLAKGEGEVFELVREDGGEYMRMMRPLYIKGGCQACHATQGYRLGDLAGGIGAKIPTTEIRAMYGRHIFFAIYVLHTSVWLIGLVGLGLGARRLHGQVRKRQEMESALQDFKASLDNINDAVLMLDTDSLSIFYSNHGAWSMTGLTGEQLRGYNVTDLLQEREKMPFYDILAGFYHGDRAALTYESVLASAGREDELPVEIHIAYVVPRKGADRFLMVVRDISERKRAEQEKTQLHMHLLQAQKLESVGMLAAGIAHEINTPLQFVSTNISFLKESFTALSPIVARVAQLPTDSPSALELQQAIDLLREDGEAADLDFLTEEIPPAINQSLEGLNRINSLVLAMKEFSRPGDRLKSYENLNAIINTTVIVSRNEWKYVADLELDLDPALPPVLCLRNEIGQVLLNLIINAAQAIENIAGKGAEAGKGKITITSFCATAGEVVISVSDTGRGIPEEIRNRIFDPFFTTREVGHGSGQGLAISRDVIVSKHGGQLTFTSEYGKGTTFVIRLPLRDEGREEQAG